MVIKNILILGNTLLTEKVVDFLSKNYNLVGYIPSKNPTIKGNINLPIKDINTECDIKLSIQYDQIIKDPINSFNVHTGLLPSYGGTNILDYTLLNKEYEQGLTFHKMTNDLDYGPIINKITYPVLFNDKVIDLYQRILLIGPYFVQSSLELLKNLSKEQVKSCFKIKPTLYKRGKFKLTPEMKKINNNEKYKFTKK